MVINMAVATGKRPKAAVVKQEAIDNTSAFLQSLPDKPKEDMSLREAIEQMREPLRAALLKGYTYQELAAMLSDQGIKISAFTLKNYVPSGRRRAAKELAAAAAAKATTGRGKRKTATADLATQIASLPAAKDPQPEPETPPAEAAPKKTGRTGQGRATAAKAKSDSGSTVKQPAAKPSSRTATKATPAKAPASKGRKKTAS
jgi:hypothetical protein